MDPDYDLVDYADEDEGMLQSIFQSHEELVRIWQCPKATQQEDLDEVVKVFNDLELPGGKGSRSGVEGVRSFKVPQGYAGTNTPALTFNGLVQAGGGRTSITPQTSKCLCILIIPSARLEGFFRLTLQKHR